MCLLLTCLSKRSLGQKICTLKRILWVPQTFQLWVMLEKYELSLKCRNVLWLYRQCRSFSFLFRYINKSPPTLSVYCVCVHYQCPCRPRPGAYVSIPSPPRQAKSSTVILRWLSISNTSHWFSVTERYWPNRAGNLLIFQYRVSPNPTLLSGGSPRCF